MNDPMVASGDSAATIIETVDELRAQIRSLLDLRLTTVAAAQQAHDTAQNSGVHAQLAQMPIDALKEATDGRLRLGPLEDAGIATVAQVRQAGPRQLEAIPGVGPKTSVQLVAAAAQVEAALRDATRVRFDVDARPTEQTALLDALRQVDLVERHVEPFAPRLEEVAAAIDADVDTARLQATRLKRFFAGRRKKEESAAALERLTDLLLSPEMSLLASELSGARAALGAPAEGPTDVWDDYLARPVVYNGLLAELAGLGPDADATHGLLPEEIVARIEAFDLDTTLLRASLRGYQAFGTTFALVQKRVILGDDMGLGKTIEALGVLTHLAAGGATHFLVVCPASVLANWEHEIRRHTELTRTFRLHGDARDAAMADWVAGGGVAITTFDTLKALTRPDIALHAVVVDEAHFVKNPGAQRTKVVRAWLAGAEHVLLMSGTPMENRVEEFRVLVDHIRPDLASRIDVSAGIAGADAFRRAVAPVYLRRNQTDVLDELPPRIDAADWLDLEGPSLAAYRDAVAAENFMAMRRAAFMCEPSTDSPKLARLLEIVDEAAENGRKVVVFSFFLDVIERVHAAVGELAVGPLTGSIPAPDRQVLVDEFSARPGPAVLVSQIEAGGVGLNIQAASVVVLTEPQWKPTTEEQAIARCHRMGQVRPVEVHRLLTEDSVDERMVEILAAKSALFADYVRQSTMRDASPAAVDVTDEASTAEVVSQAQQEAEIIAAERERLGLAAG
ncbi:DEAD/DEAH box helicase [Actinomarinicola tropica]|uniref:DEAD/DEAH box helicase n=1 Tax=Actinomarinicola tropica TaxID=2789776 RepID=UPI00189B5625|nr:DEAD/DEAH box helicase [Actinomarinicola tropica]